MEITCVKCGALMVRSEADVTQRSDMGMTRIIVMLDCPNCGPLVPEPEQPVAIVTEPADPSATGRKKYEPDGYYEGYPCTCDPSCESSCKGKCGCEACNACYQDFLSFE